MAHYDLVVVGAGPGGLSAAKQAAKHGARVAIAERSNLGGVCVNQGCIPKKLMVYAADSAQLVQNLVNYGWQVSTGEFDWMAFMSALHQEVERLRQVQGRSLTDAGVVIYNGHAKFLDSHTLEIAKQTVTADHVLIATGGKPIRPKAIAGIDHALTSDDMFRLTAQPNKIAIIGAGYIGVEFASIFCGLGTEVVLINQDDGILNGFDDDLRHAVQQGLHQRGITLRSNTMTNAIEPTEQGVQLHLSSDRSHQSIDKLTADLVLCATGRAPNVDNLGLENTGVEVKAGAIAVDAYSRTHQTHIFAIGDCTNRVPLTPVVRAEGKAVADTIFGNCPTTIDYDLIPSAVFSRPEAATVGMSETKARQTLGEIECSKTQFRPLFHTFSSKDETTLVKLVSDRSSEKILGVHMVGENAAEIIQALTPAIQQGITKPTLQQAIGIHPSSGEEVFALK